MTGCKEPKNREAIDMFVYHLGLKTFNYAIYFLFHLKLCLATATHNLKWVEIIHICFI